MFDTAKPGPYYEDFQVGATIPPLPAVTLTAADNSLYRAVTGDQHALAADAAGYRAVSGRDRPLANPGLVLQYSIGQTTMATRQAIANLYYRAVRVLRPVELGQSLSTTTTVLGLQDASPKDGQQRGKVWLGIRTVSDDGVVAQYERCALIRSRRSSPLGHADAIPGPSEPTPLAELVDRLPPWDLSSLPATGWAPDEVRTDPLRDHIDLAAPLARLTFNQAAIHRDHTLTANGQRLVYGGHVQGLAQASLTRMLPGLAFVPAWDGCDHTGPAAEGDLLEFQHRVVEQRDAGSGRLLRFEVVGAVVRGDDRVPILRWTPVIWAR